MQSQQSSRSNLGFTLIEILIVVMVIGILCAIAAPTWTTFIERQYLNKSQSQIHQAMQEAKSNAVRDKITWQLSFRQVTLNQKQVAQWALHPAEEGKFIPDTVLKNDAHWHNLDSHVLIDQSKNDQGKYETSVIKQSATGPWRVQFNNYGCPVSQAGDDCGQTSLTAMGRVTLRSRNGGKIRRCVIVSTLLGAMRDGKDHPKADSTGKYCH
ncbi:MAG: type II secretion system protein [Microcoleus sp. SIO2G3]|nr:type II secretion system protein [Microcoleus sp. SIO2G3]